VSAALLALNERTFVSIRKHRNFRLFFTGQVISVSGTWMQNVALAWFVYELTGSPLAVGVLTFCRFAPQTLFGLFAGVLADRLDNRRLVMGTQAASMVVSIALAALALSGAAVVWHVYVLAVLAGLAQVFDSPGRHALVFQLVGREELPNAIALNTSVFNASRIVGPGIAGLLIASVGVGACFALNAVSFVAVLAALLLMDTRELHPLARPDAHPTLLRGVREGLAYARADRRVSLVLLLVLVVGTLGVNNGVILPVLATELDAGPKVFGLLSAVFGAGALVGALATATLGRASWKALLAGTIGFGIAMLLVAPQSTVAACAALLLVAGMCFTLWSSNSNSLLQMAAPDHLRGRVLSLYLFAFHGLAPAGGLLIGWLIEVGGTDLAFELAGISALAMAAFLLPRRPFELRTQEGLASSS
jgi:MFS family permease